VLYNFHGAIVLSRKENEKKRVVCQFDPRNACIVFQVPDCSMISSVWIWGFQFGLCLDCKFFHFLSVTLNLGIRAWNNKCR
jgi:hypothetical protein